MALKNLFNTLKAEGYIVKLLDQYLLAMSDTEEDRRYDTNSPSMSSTCVRAIYYSRTNARRDAGTIDARTRRIFDNGTEYHNRMQKYLSDMGMLLMMEVPVFDIPLKTQGHTDGILSLSPRELGVLELKSINSNGFSQLIDAKEEHKYQAQVYLHCVEMQRRLLKKLYPTQEAFDRYLKSPKTRLKYHKLYAHLKGGKKYTRSEKLAFKVKQHLKLDTLLWMIIQPVNKMVFLYENKDTQELKEFVVTWDDAIMTSVIEKFKYVNECVETKIVPKREGTSKSCNTCRWCPFKGKCWVV